jgi:hypothetical protein
MRFIVIVLICVVIAGHLAVSCGNGNGADCAHVIAEFDMRDCGDFWYVPVTVAENRYRFLVDTGTGRPLFHCSLREFLGEPLADETFTTSAGTVNGELYIAPHALVGTLPLDRTMPVGCLDLRHLATFGGPDFGGVIGVTFLRDYIVEFDFERARLRFLDSVEPDAGREVPFAQTDDVRPYCRCRINRQREESFMIDTGDASFFSASLERGVFDEVLCGSLEAVRRGAEPTVIPGGEVPRRSIAGGAVTSRCAQLRRLAIGDSEVEYLYIATANRCKLGLGLLSQSIVTIDFPKKRIFLKPIPGAENDEFRTGIFLRRQGQQTFINSISPSAAKAGLLRGDEILAVGGADARSMHIFAIRRLLFQNGHRVGLTIKRGGVEMSIAREAASMP